MSMSRLPRRTSSVLQKLRLTWGGLDLQKQKLTENNKKITAAYMFPYSSIWITRRCLLKSVNLRSFIQLQTTVEPLLTRANSLQRSIFGGQSMHWLLFKPLYDGHLSSTAWPFSVLWSGRCGERFNCIQKNGKKTVGEKFGKKSV